MHCANFATPLPGRSSDSRYSVLSRRCSCSHRTVLQFGNASCNRVTSASVTCVSARYKCFSFVNPIRGERSVNWVPEMSSSVSCVRDCSGDRSVTCVSLTSNFVRFFIFASADRSVICVPEISSCVSLVRDRSGDRSCTSVSGRSSSRSWASFESDFNASHGGAVDSQILEIG